MADMGATIGGANVRITPNTRKFAGELRKKLQDAEKRIAMRLRVEIDTRQLSRQVSSASKQVEQAAEKIDLPTDIDAAKVAESARRASKVAERAVEKVGLGFEADTSSAVSTVQKSVSTAKRAVGKIILPLDVNGAQVAAGVRKAASAARRALPEINIPLGARAATLVASVRRAAGKAKAVSGKISLPIDADNSRLLRSVRAAAALVQRVSKINIPVGVAARGLVVGVKAAVARAQAAAGKIDVWIDVHKSQLLMLPRLFGGLSRFSGMVAGLSVAAGGAVSVLGGLAPIITAVGAAAVSAAVPIGTLAAGLAPAALGGAILGVGTLKSIVAGLGDVLKETDPEKYAEKFSQLPSGIKPAVAEIRKLQNSFKLAGQAAQTAFFQKLQNLGQIRNLIAPIRTAMVSLAAEMGRTANALIQFTTSGSGLVMMKQLILNARSAMVPLVQAFGQATRGIIALGAAGSPILVEMSWKVNKLAQDWQQKMVTAFNNGSLEAGMRRGVAVLGELWTKVQQVGSIVGNVFSAMNAAGQPFLGTIGQIIESMSRWTGSDTGMYSMTVFFQSLSAATAAVAPLIGQVASILATTLVPAASQTIQVLAPFVSTVLEGMRKGLEAIAPVLPQIGEQLGQAMSSLAPVLPVVGDAIAQILQAIAPLVPLVARMAAEILPTLIPVVVGFVQAAAKVLEWAIQALPVLLPVAAAIFALVNPFGAVAIAVGGLVGALVAFWPQITQWVSNLVGRFRDMVIEVRDKCDQFEQNVKDTFVRLWNSTTQTVARMWNAVVSWFVNGANWAGAKITQFKDAAVNKFVSVKNSMVNAISVAWNTVKNWFINGANSAVNVVVGLAQRIGTWFLNIRNRMVNMIMGTWNAVTSWFRSGGTNSVNIIASFAQRVWNWFTNLRAGMVNRVQAAWQAVVAYFRVGVQNAISWVSSLPQRAVNALGNVGNLLFNSGKALIRGFIEGIKSMFGAVGRAAKGAVQKARDFFPNSPAKTGPFSGRGWVLYSGRAVGESFAAGIEQRSRGVGAATQSLMDAAQGNLDGFRADVRAVTSVNDVANGGGRVAADYSISVGTIIAADEERPLREMKQMQQMALIRGGAL